MNPGDPEQPNDPRRIREDIEVEGLLSIADGTVCDGDVKAPGGLVLGADVRVKGNVYTDGAVEIGPGTRIEGEIRPLGAESPGGADGTRPREPPKLPEPVPAADETDGADTLRRAALASTLDALMTTALEEGSPEARQLGLRPDALEDLLEGAYDLIADLYRDEEAQRPWSIDEVEQILVKRVLPLVVPVALDGGDEHALRLRVARPEPTHGKRPAPPDWPGPVLAFVERLIQTVRPNIRVERLTRHRRRDRPLSPSVVQAVLFFDTPS